MCVVNLPEEGASATGTHKQCSVSSTLYSHMTVEGRAGTNPVSSTSSAKYCCSLPETSRTSKPSTRNTDYTALY